MRPLRFIASIIISAVASLPLLTGCESTNASQQPAPGSVNNPLPFDPTERITLGEWWFNGERLLHLRPDNVYALYPGENRYHAPEERGQWSHDSYAALFLNPYELRHGGRERVLVDRRDNEIILERRGMPIFRAIKSPPTVVEDFLIGTWNAGESTLELLSSGRYRMRRVATGAGPAHIAGHEGAWRLNNEQLTLQPNATGLPVVRFNLVREEVPVTDGDGAVDIRFSLREADGPTWTSRADSQ